LVSSHDKSLHNKLIENLPFVCIQIRTPSFQYIAKDRNFLVTDEGVRHETSPLKEKQIILDPRFPSTLVNPPERASAPTSRRPRTIEEHGDDDCTGAPSTSGSPRTRRGGWQ
jgi:hypothetical protein